MVEIKNKLRGPGFMPGALLCLLVAACQNPAPSPAPTAAPTPTVAPTATPTLSAAPTAEPTAVPSAEPSVEPSAEPSASPVDIVIKGRGSETSGSFVLPAATLQATLTAVPVQGATACSITATLIPGDVVVGKGDSSGPTIVALSVPAGTYSLRVHDPNCDWTVALEEKR
jgi:hypothetical protein